MTNLASRFVLPVLLLATAGHWHHHGLDALPRWGGSLGQRAGIDEFVLARLAIGAMAATALTLLMLGAASPARRRFALVVAGFYAFAAVASVSALLATPLVDASSSAPIALPILGAIAALAAYAILMKAAPSAKPAARVGGLWQPITVVVIWGACIGVGARLDLAPRSEVTRGSATETIFLDPVAWQGRMIPDTGLSRLAPMLTARTLEGRSIVILYSPECGHCREVFERYLAHPITDTRVIAIEIPPNPGSVPLSGDALGEMPCEGCERMKLPEGHQYAVKAPTVLVVLEGRVTCATESDFDACLASLPPLPPPASTVVTPQSP